MSCSRLAAAAATLACVLVPVLATGTASAQTPLTQKVQITGTKGFKGTYTIDRFVARGQQLVAVGDLRGRLRGKRVTKRNVRIPVALARAAQQSQIPPTPNACQILNLTLQPIDLNLLGLRVRTSRIDLRIEGVPGGGNLVGNLLCGILGILDPAATPLGDISRLLNSILALVPTRPTG
jgi:hypothetical protein